MCTRTIQVNSNIMVMKFDTPKISGEYDTLSGKKFQDGVALTAQLGICYDNVKDHVIMTLICSDVTDLARALEITAENVPDFRRALLTASKLIRGKILKGQIR